MDLTKALAELHQERQVLLVTVALMRGKTFRKESSYAMRLPSGSPPKHQPNHRLRSPQCFLTRRFRLDTLPRLVCFRLAPLAATCRHCPSRWSPAPAAAQRHLLYSHDDRIQPLRIAPGGAGFLEFFFRTEAAVGR
jgi:hypothetical protein